DTPLVSLVSVFTCAFRLTVTAKQSAPTAVSHTRVHLVVEFICFSPCLAFTAIKLNPVLHYFENVFTWNLVRLQPLQTSNSLVDRLATRGNARSRAKPERCSAGGRCPRNKRDSRSPK